MGERTFSEVLLATLTEGEGTSDTTAESILETELQRHLGSTMSLSTQLHPDVERELITAVAAGRQAKEVAAGRSPSRVPVRVRRSIADGEAALERLVIANLARVHRVGRDISSPLVDPWDVMQAGLVALVEAARSVDVSHKSFASWSAPRISRAKQRAADASALLIGSATGDVDEDFEAVELCAIEDLTLLDFVADETSPELAEYSGDDEGEFTLLDVLESYGDASDDFDDEDDDGDAGDDDDEEP